MIQDICYINFNCERNLCTVSAYIEWLLSIVEIKNKCLQICSKQKTPIKLVYDKLIISIDGLKVSNLPRQIDHPKCTILAKDTIVLDFISQNCFKE